MRTRRGWRESDGRQTDAGEDRRGADLTIHDVCALFPGMTDAEFAGLKADIQAHGQREPIWTYRGRNLDGRHRDRACRALGMKTIRAEIRTVDASTAYRLALAENVQRNSLTPIEEALAFQKLLDEGTSQAEVARSLGVDFRQLAED